MDRLISRKDTPWWLRWSRKADASMKASTFTKLGGMLFKFVSQDKPTSHCKMLNLEECFCILILPIQFHQFQNYKHTFLSNYVSPIVRPVDAKCSDKIRITKIAQNENKIRILGLIFMISWSGKRLGQNNTALGKPFIGKLHMNIIFLMFHRICWSLAKMQTNQFQLGQWKTKTTRNVHCFIFLFPRTAKRHFKKIPKPEKTDQQAAQWSDVIGDSGSVVKLDSQLQPLMLIWWAVCIHSADVCGNPAYHFCVGPWKRFWASDIPRTFQYYWVKMLRCELI